MPCPNNELKLLSESPQKRNMNLPEADKLTRRSIRHIEHFKGKPRSKMTEAKSCACASLFRTTALKSALKSNAKHVSINEKQFQQSLADNMCQRLLTTAAVAAQSTSATGSTQECESQGKLIIAQLSVNNAEYWPNEMDANYGEEEVHLLCQRFRLSYATVRDAILGQWWSTDYTEIQGFAELY